MTPPGSAAFYRIRDCLGSGNVRYLEEQVAIADRNHYRYAFSAAPEFVRVSALLPKSIVMSSKKFSFHRAFEEEFTTRKPHSALTAEFATDLTCNLYISECTINDRRSYKGRQLALLDNAADILRSRYSTSHEISIFIPRRAIDFLYFLANTAGQAVLRNNDSSAIVPIKHNGKYVPSNKPGLELIASKWIGHQERPRPELWITQEQIRRVLSAQRPLSEKRIADFCTILNEHYRRPD